MSVIKQLPKKTAGVLKGEYGAAPAAVNKELQVRVLEGGKAVTCRPADLIEPEMHKLIAEVEDKAKEENVTLAKNVEEDALINGLFALVGWKFIANRGNPDAFEPGPNPETLVVESQKPESEKSATETYSVNVDGRSYNVAVGPGGSNLTVQQTTNVPAGDPVASSGGAIESPMAGIIFES